MTQQNTVRISDLMVSGVKTIDGLATVAQAMAAMKEYNVSSLVVDRRNSDDELGVITVTDIAREVVATNRAAERVNVYEIMSKPVLTVRGQMQARYAARLLVHFGVSRTLVVDDAGNPMGIVTLRDMVMGLAPAQ
ncbi:MAG: CBS domain-containing protein [Chloroflexota bacterium]|nr:CBS domain-containing protein [Chloroflexota bacterium]